MTQEIIAAGMEHGRAVDEVEPIPGSVGIVFSGQGVTRRADVYNYHDQLSAVDPSVVRNNIALMEEASGLPLSKYVIDKDETVLGRTDVLQTMIHGLHLSAIDFLQPTLEDAKQVKKVAGHSGGEVAVLVAAGVLDERDSAEVMARRAQYMHEDAQRTSSGLFFPAHTDRATAKQIVRHTLWLMKRYQEAGTIEALSHEAQAIFLDAAKKEEIQPDELLSQLEERPRVLTLCLANEPTVNVLGGRNGELILAKQVAITYGVRRNVQIDAEGAFHSPLMRGAQLKFGRFYRGVPLNQSRFPVALNNGSITRDPNQMREGHIETMTHTVEWTGTMKHMRDMKTVIKVGPGGSVPGVSASNGIPDERQVAIIAFLIQRQTRN